MQLSTREKNKKRQRSSIRVEDILDRITTKEGLEYYGVHFDRKGFAHCPFHSEKTPSFHYDKRKDRYYCFSCNKGGTIIDFVAEYFNFSLPKELPQVLEKINADFNLGLGKPLTKEEKKAFAEERKLNEIINNAEKTFKDEINQNYDKWCRIYSVLYRENDNRDSELNSLLQKLDAALDDFSGNELRAWPLPSLSETQLKYISHAEESIEKQPGFQDIPCNIEPKDAAGKIKEYEK